MPEALSRPLLDLMFPRRCCGCGRDIDAKGETGLCWDCRAESVMNAPPWCERCGIVVAGRVDHAFTCEQCLEHPPAYRRARGLFRYEGGVREAIHALKYHRNFSVVPDLAALLAAGIRVHVSEDPGELVLTPVPLHRQKLRSRGFNQSLELVKAVRRELPGSGIWTGVRRIRHTETQTHLSRAGRLRNVKGAFRAQRGRVPRRVVLIDDVMTTGATVDACARALRRAGTEDIQVVTLARG